MAKVKFTHEIDLWDVIDVFSTAINDHAAQVLDEEGIDPNLLDDWVEVGYRVTPDERLEIDIKAYYEETE